MESAIDEQNLFDLTAKSNTNTMLGLSQLNHTNIKASKRVNEMSREHG
jgi:hypothetical protein